MTNKENLLDVLRTLFRWKKQIIIVCALAAVGSIIISLFLSNYYQSSTLFYAASPDLALPSAVGNEIKEKDYYGEETDIDRMLTISESNEIADFLIDSFHLYEHYDIDTAQLRAAFKVKKRFFSLYNVKKTKYDAIEISMEDKEPPMAAAMVNAARDKVNQIGQNLIKDSQKKQMEAFNQSITEKEKELKTLGDSLQVLRKRYGVFNTITQSEALTQLVAQAEAKLARAKAKKELLATRPGRFRDSIFLLNANIAGLEQEVINLNRRMDLFNEGMAIVDVLEQQHTEAREQLGLDKERRKQLESTYQSDFSAIHLVEKGDVPIVKSRPKRSIIVLSAIFITFLFSLIAILILDTYRDVNWRDIVHGR